MKKINVNVEDTSNVEETVCGYFVGYKMSYQELRYNLFRMLGKFGLRSIIPNGNSVFLFKFRNNEGILLVIEMGPCMVNGKPMFVQKWDPSVSLDKNELNKLPQWVKLRNLPLEAWTSKGISAVASRLGNPLIMDQTTTQICKAGYGRLGFARVLIDVEAEKRLPDKIDTIYKKRDGLVTAKKSVDINYDWSPPRRKRSRIKMNLKKIQEERGEEDELKWLEEISKGVEQVKDKRSPKNGWKGEILEEEGIEKEKEFIDVYDDTSGSTKKKAQNDTGPSYVEVLNGMDSGVVLQKRVFYTFVHAEISGKLRKKLWSDLNFYKGMINDGPWVIIEDLNVSLNLDDHYKGISSMSQDMEEFKECIKDIKMEDICRSGLHYTWIKSLLNPNSSILKKIDRVTVNEEFIEEYLRAHAVFLPYGISDHSPAVLTCPQTIKAKSRSFRFATYIADKEDFLGVIKDNWKTDVDGFTMFKLAKKPKSLKPAMNKLNWKNGNLFENVKKLKKDLDEKSKVEWLKEGDRYTGDQVPIQFVKHFQMFLGEQNNKECLDLDDTLFSSKIDDQSWNIIGEDVCNAVKEFFSKGKLLKELNATLITLVPKVSTPNKVSEFRPIACCNVVYKCISKVLTNRIKSSLENIVDKNQSAFIPNRQITDTILLTQELMKGYDCINGPKRCSMKIDIQKAYDTRNWKFLENALRLFVFHPKMVHWIMTYVSTPSYTICLNGERHDYFKGGRGLRQGDPLSPHLFTLVMEVLNLILHQEFLRNGTHVIKVALEKFSAVSRLYPNLGKSTIFCGSMDRGLKPLESWNNAIFLKHLWNVANKKDSLWVKWISTIKLRERSVWEVEIQQNDSWIWKSLLELRSGVRDNMIYKIGNGKKASILHDKWSDKPSMDTIVSRRDIYTAGFNINDTVFSVIKENQWIWPKEWFLKYPILNQIPVPNINNAVEDKLIGLGRNMGRYVWHCERSNSSGCTISQEYRVLVLKVNWKSAVECLDMEAFFSICASRTTIITDSPKITEDKSLKTREKLKSYLIQYSSFLGYSKSADFFEMMDLWLMNKLTATHDD
nr:hypothetical protein [Tanacetum cinerariifolium]